MEKSNLGKKKALYLPGLNGIRAIAALAVVISHVHGNLGLFGLTAFRWWDLANFGVTLFFALSGFLISFLLFKEMEKTKTINIPKFYIRRILRIWPLYYFYLFLILLLLGYSQVGDIFYAFLMILPNFATSGILTDVFGLGAATTGLGWMLMGHYWSLGVEEQFYAVWPWVVRKIKRVLPLLVMLPIGFLGLKVIAKFLDFPFSFQVFLHYSRFGCLAIGCLGAWLYWKKSPILNYFKSVVVQLIPWILLTLLFFNSFHIFSIIDHEIIAVATVIIIINQIDNPKNLISLENPVFDYLGKISYGLYVYNLLIIWLLSLLLKDRLFGDSFWSLIIIYPLCIGGVILTAHISYFYFESKFLKLKNKFAVIRSRSSSR